MPSASPVVDVDSPEPEEEDELELAEDDELADAEGDELVLVPDCALAFESSATAACMLGLKKSTKTSTIMASAARIVTAIPIALRRIVIPPVCATDSYGESAFLGSY